VDFDSKRLFSRADRWFYEPLSRYRARDEYLRLVVPLLPMEWGLHREAQWLVASPPGQDIPCQGWSIEASARPADAERVLRAVAVVCVETGRSFEFTADRRLHELTNSKGWPRAHSGRFITIYPHDEAECRALLERLHRETTGAEGPYILSDRRYCDSRVLFYRYGAMRSRQRLQMTGERVTVLIAPGGEEAVDHRTPYCDLPPWVTDPFPPHEEGAAGDEPLNGRYTVTEAFRFSATGGVYLCVDEETGRRVIVKEARPHTAPGPDGDATSRLRAEFRLMGRLNDTGLVPAPLELFQDWEHTFLAEEYIDSPPAVQGELNPLLHPAPTPDLVRGAFERWRRIWIQLILAVQAVHARGIVMGDLSPSNVVLSDPAAGQGLRLVDFEAAFEPAVEPRRQLSTPGYRWPRGVAAGVDGQRTDWYSVGAVMLATLLPINVLLELDPAAGRPFLRAFADDLGLPAGVAEVVGTLMDTQHALRSGYPEQAMRLIAASPPPTGPHPVSTPRRQEVQDTIDSAVDAILDSAEPSRSDRLFPGDPQLHLTNPLSLAWGAAGVAHAVKQAGHELPPQVIAWILSRRINPEHYPPGLLVGSAGIAWALWDLGLEEVAMRTMAAAGDHPLLRESADLLSGTAGHGLACLRFHTATGDRFWLERAARDGEWLLTHRLDDERGCCWPNTGEAVALGLGMGAAGIAQFLLRLASAADDDRFLRVGMRALDFDLSHRIDSAGDFWAFPEAVPAGGNETPATSTAWMGGSAGIASVALRYHLATGEPRFRAAFESIVPGVMLRYSDRPGLFHGLAGVVLSLVDWHRLTGEDRFLAAAHAAVRGLLLFRVRWKDRVAFPGESLQRLSMDLATGSAGVVLALHRYLEALG
jgi:serine/threonine protein kinase